MKVTSEINLRDFDAWSGAVETKERIINEGKVEEFESLVEEMFENGLTDTELNDLLWFDEDWLIRSLGIDAE